VSLVQFYAKYSSFASLQKPFSDGEVPRSLPTVGAHDDPRSPRPLSLLPIRTNQCFRRVILGDWWFWPLSSQF